MKWLGLLVIGVLLFGTTPVSMIMAQEPPRDLPDPVMVRGNWARLTPIILDFDRAVELAYAVRNITYDLFYWEISYNVTSARVQFEKAEMFLKRALNLSEITPRRAAVLAFVAAVHYSHAPALANPILGRVITENLGENNTITEQTVQAVIAVSSELRQLLVGAINKAGEFGVNTTLVEALLSRGDERIENATKLLEEGNVDVAFRHAVSGYRTYVRAYSTLIRTTFAKYIKEVESGFSRALLKPVDPPAKRLLPLLPERVREMVRARIEAGDIRDMHGIIDTVKEYANRIREQVRLVEKRNLEEVLKRRVIETARERGEKEQLEKIVSEVVEEAYREGYRGIGLVRRVMEQLRERLQERIGERANEIRIPELPGPAKPSMFRIGP